MLHQIIKTTSNNKDPKKVLQKFGRLKKVTYICIVNNLKR